MADKKTPKAKPKAAAVPALLELLPPAQLQRVATLPERTACPVRAGDRFGVVLRIGEAVRFIDGRPTPKQIAALFSKTKPAGAVDVDVSKLRALLN
jgi:hypothetical protein